MGGIAKSIGGLLGTEDGPKANVNNQNGAMDMLQGANRAVNDSAFQGGLMNYANGTGSLQDALGSGSANVPDPEGEKAISQLQAMKGQWDPTGTRDKSIDAAISQYRQKQTANTGANQAAKIDSLASNPLTGTKLATDQVQNNPILGQLFGKDGELGKSIGKEQQLQNQGFQLTPEDQTMYGQTSGNVARMFGQQGNQAAQSLASRGLASGKSGAAGAMFSGLQGNQNEMLANAQQDIMQQRFQNTQNQIAQQQKFIGEMGNQGANAINQQYGRNMQGVENHQNLMSGAAGLQMKQNQASNADNLAGQKFEQENKPQNIVDMATGAVTSGLGAAGKTVGDKAGAALSKGIF